MIISSPVAPPLGTHQVLLLLAQLVLLLSLAFGAGRLARRIGLPTVVGELMTGVVLGPSLLGWAAPTLSTYLFPARPEQAHLLDAISLLGVLLLVGVAGAHLDIGFVHRRRATVGKLAAATLVIPLALGVGTAFLVPDELLGAAGDRLTFAAFLGVALAMSAIPVIAKTLSDLNLMHRDIGQLTLAVAGVDDTVAWFLLSIVPALTLTGLALTQVVLSVGSLLVYLAVAATVGQLVIRRVMRRAARVDDPAPTVVAAVVIVLVGSATSHALGLEAVLGAFVAGVIIGSPGMVKPRHLAPLRTVVFAVLAPIFLATAGLRMDLTALTDPTVLAAGVAVLAVAVTGKVAGAVVGARLSGMSLWEGLALGAGLNARGAVEVVVATVGLRIGILTTASYTVLILVALVTSVMAPPMMRWVMRRVEQNDAEAARFDRLAEWTTTPLGTAPAGKVVVQPSDRD